MVTTAPRKNNCRLVAASLRQSMEPPALPRYFHFSTNFAVVKIHGTLVQHRAASDALQIRAPSDFLGEGGDLVAKIGDRRERADGRRYPRI